jgi:isopenicillin N synthase-like dioxygenase
MPQHFDISLVTLLSTFENYGLQVRKKENNWVWVRPIKNTLIVNLGHILENITEGKLPATIHRVMDLGEHR